MRPLRRLRGDDRGALLVFVAVAIAALMGLIALSFDLGRMAATQTELQSFADNVALAAAAELDGRANAISRATSAANALITDRQTFGEGGATLNLNDFRLTFLSNLDTDDRPNGSGVYADTIVPPPYNAAADRAARLVRVDVIPREVELTFASVLSEMTGNDAPDSDVAASAVAGFTQVACEITPMFFCLPSPSFTAAGNIGKQIVLRTGGNGAAWGPGDFGFLDITEVGVNPYGPCAGRLSGRNLYSCIIGAAGAITQCYTVQGGVDMEPGQRNGVAEAAFNVRFDIYRSTMNNEDRNPDYAPAPNVIKGVVPASGGGGGNGNGNNNGGNGGGGGGGNQCIGMNGQAAPNSIALPKDSCVAAGTCRFGSGDWDRATYVQTNHNGTNPSSTLPLATMTRYEMYMAEIAQPGSATRLMPERDPTNALRPESGRPQCSNQTPAGPDRRVIVAAGIDCASISFSGSAENIPVQEYFKIFLTEPIRDDGLSPPNVDILGEIIGSAGGSGSTPDGTFRDVVQLYR